ncbi:MAG: type II toxin-antitoxin system HicB family antitoxin [Candidatus Levybacteria bacterium]|nr:type II toxin-antitoxin system HicB family antitoxin [Candidatus Levybacteria bacterium]
MAKKKVAKILLKYTAIFEPAEEGGYVVSVPSLPGCVTQGETFEEAVEMIKDAISGYLAVQKEMGEELPQEPEGIVVTLVRVPQPST